MRKVLLATKNRGKQKEYAALLAPLNWQVITLADLDETSVPDVVEDGQSFVENALKKAHVYHQAFSMPVLADDSGLEVAALQGKPGIYSARYAGETVEDKLDEANNKKLLEDMKDISFENRQARFTCVIALVRVDQDPLIATGHCSGFIATTPEGSGGFGYDPLFLLPDVNKTMATLSPEEKNKRSHRYHALQDLIKKLAKNK